MNAKKYKNMQNEMSKHCFMGYQTQSAILKQIPEELLNQLTGKQLGLIAGAINAAYQKGKASIGAEIIDNNPLDGSIWINCLNRAIEWKQSNEQLNLIARPAHFNN